MTTIREAQQLRDAVKFKIHAITSVNGVGRSANNNVFYDTFEQAEAKCQEYLRKDTGCEGFVIMTTCAIIKRQVAPTSTFLVRESGMIEEVN